MEVLHGAFMSGKLQIMTLTGFAIASMAGIKMEPDNISLINAHIDLQNSKIKTSA